MSEEIFKEEKFFTQHDVENKQLKEENEQLRKENEQLRKNNVVKDAKIKELIEKLKEIKSPKEDKNTTDYYPNWFDRNRFKKVLAIIDSNTFSFCQTVSFKNSFLRYAIKEWNKLDSEIRNAKTYASFPKMLLKFIRPIENIALTKFLIR